ncbi:phage portal protein [Secundilactobacillus yichangensis]|uniref:phage portal protein n=1 Tax=Secundilactobacillus yichangensis TaxID=2799580 RepID=UPI0019420964|nr:phage portal protein [Secundilactobacillus yichangensis]
MVKQIKRHNNQDLLISGQRLANLGRFGDAIDLGDNIQINDSDVFTYPAEMNLLAHLEDVNTMINYHRDFLVGAYKMKRDYYKGRHERIIRQKGKSLGKPDNRIIVNYPKKLINTFNGFFSGDPVQVSYEENGNPNETINKQIQDFLKRNDYDDVFSEASKMADIYGRSYLYCYMDDQPTPQLHMTVTSPIDTFAIYDDTVEHNQIAAVRYTYRNAQMKATVITDKGDYQISNTNEDGTADKAHFTNLDEDGSPLDTHPLPICPVIEFEENEERLGLLDDVVNIIDSIDRSMSEKMNDVDYFGDAYLAITGVKLTDKQKAEIKDSKLFNLYPSEDEMDSNIQPTVEFLNKLSNDETQEHYLDRAVDMLYQITQVVNLSDSTFGMSADAASGVALINKYQAMQAMAKTKSRKMSKMLRKLFSIFFDVANIDGEITNLTFTYQQAVPHNDSEEATTFSTVYGKIPDEKALQYLSKIDDPKAVAKEMAKDREKDGINLAQATAKVGEDNGQPDNGEATNTGAPQPGQAGQSDQQPGLPAKP